MELSVAKAELDKLKKSRGRGVSPDEYEAQLAEAQYQLKLAQDRHRKSANGAPRNHLPPKSASLSN